MITYTETEITRNNVIKDAAGENGVYDDYWICSTFISTELSFKEHQIIHESVHSYLCTCTRNKCPCKSEFVWNVHIHVMLKFISFSILNIHDLVETWLPEE